MIGNLLTLSGDEIELCLRTWHVYIMFDVKLGENDELHNVYEGSQLDIS
jgi:hypothetical protein